MSSTAGGSAIESFNETILHRLARFNELEHDPMLLGPLRQSQRDELRTVVCSELEGDSRGQRQSVQARNTRDALACDSNAVPAAAPA